MSLKKGRMFYLIGKEIDEIVTANLPTLRQAEIAAPDATSIPAPMTVSDDGIFKMTIGGATPSSTAFETSSVTEHKAVFMPSPRMSCGMAVKHGVLYLYGGMVEDGDKQLTLCDFYALDLHRLDEWRIIIPNDISSIEWLGSGSESEGESDDGDDSDDDSQSESSEEESDDKDKMEVN